MAGAKRSGAVDALLRGALRAADGIPLECLRGKRLLLVEDQPTDLARLVALLGRLGGDDLEVSSARTASAALDICRSHGGRFDIVLLNHLLGPAEDTGLELLGLLQRAGLPTSAKAVLYSANMPVELVRLARAAGFDETLEGDAIDAITLRDTFNRLLPSAAAAD